MGQPTEPPNLGRKNLCDPVTVSMVKPTLSITSELPKVGETISVK